MEKERQISKFSKCNEMPGSNINIYLDLQVEILKKLPIKSLLRFRCVSKQWLTIIESTHFIDLIIARPLPEPPTDNLHFIFHHCSSKPFFFFSSTYTWREQDIVPISTKCKINGSVKYQYVRGLICYWPIFSRMIIVYNPTTKQSISLPEVKSYDKQYCYYLFGYEPVMNQYKVMCILHGKDKSEHACRVFTLGDPMKQWRNIQGIGKKHYVVKGVQINGIIYYRAKDSNGDMVMSFDLKSERFYQINAPTAVTNIFKKPILVNYKGKLGCLCTKDGAEIWVMEDNEKQTWSNTIFDTPEIIFPNLVELNPPFGVTLGGEFFTIESFYNPGELLYVFFYDPKQNCYRKSKIKGGTKQRKGVLLIEEISVHVENILSLHRLAGE